MTERRDASGRLQLLLIAAVFLGPLALAAWLYYGGESMQPEGRVNHGALLTPIVNVAEIVPSSGVLAQQQRRWLLVYDGPGQCDAACRDGLHTIRQLRLMLGRDRDRLLRVFLHGSTAPDTVFLAEEHEGLLALEDPSLSELLRTMKPDGLDSGGYFLIDPLANLVLYFEPDLPPDDIVEDIKRLLRQSRIG
ncbi:MAG: hypothetical protein R3288_07310 [Woeseiaceae bacterium]|nr:hypothetical protein [Woeseiaceae bacterium]